MLGAQAEMHASLAGVGRDVEHTRGQVGQVRGAAGGGWAGAGVWREYVQHWTQRRLSASTRQPQRLGLSTFPNARRDAGAA